MSKNFFDEFKTSFNGLNLTYGEVGKKYGDVFDLADAFLCIDSMTHKKLQKLCYYAKAWYLAINDTNIITEPFEAWVHGAVQPALYQKYKVYGFGYIPLNNKVADIPEEFISFAREIYDTPKQSAISAIPIPAIIRASFKVFIQTTPFKKYIHFV